MKDTLTTPIPPLFQRSDYLLVDEKKEFSDLSMVFAGIFFYICVVIWRSWNNYSHPGLYAEDSIHYFNIYYGNTKSFIDAIQQRPHGYLNIFNNIAAFLIAKVDVLIQPRLYQLVSTVLTILTVSAFSFSGLLKNRALLFVAPVLLGLSGMNHVHYYITLTFQMYVVVVLLLVLLLSRRFTSVSAQFFLFLLMSFLIWSGPYSVLAVPFCLIFMVLFRGRNWLFCGVILATLLYVLSVKESTVQLGNLFHPDILALWGKTLVTDVFFMGLKDSVNPEKLLLIASFFGVVYFTLRKDVFFLKSSLLFWTIIVASFAPYFLSEKYLIYKAIFPCHLLIAQFFWLAFVLVIGDRIMLRMPRYSAWLGTGVALLALGFTAWDNALTPTKWQKPIFISLPAFLQEVKRLESSGLAERHEKVAVLTPGSSGVSITAVVGERGDHSKLVRIIRIP